MLLLVELQEACNVTKSNIPSWMFFTFFKLYGWYQIAQSITYDMLPSPVNRVRWIISDDLKCNWGQYGTLAHTLSAYPMELKERYPGDTTKS